MTQNFDKNPQEKKNPVAVIAGVIIVTLSIIGFQAYGYFKPNLALGDKNTTKIDNDYSLTDLTEEDASNEQEETSENTTSILEEGNENKENYLHNAIGSNGQINKWNKKQIVVYVDPSEYQTTIYSAFASYNSTFPELFKFVTTKYPQKADIVVKMVNQLEKEAQEYFKQGETNLQYNGSGEITSANIKLLSYDSKNLPISKETLYAVALHEIGHAIGITGHSQEKSDVMYGFKSKGQFSDSDINTIKLMYSKNETEVANAKSGYQDTKLQEALDYTKKIPDKTTSWIQLGQVYYDQGRLTEALDAYKKALTIDYTDSEVYRSMAQCYYASKKYETAIKYFKLAKDYSSDKSEMYHLDENIGICYHKQNKFNEAYPYLKSAYEANPKNKGNLYNFISVCANLDKKEDARQAIEQYKKLGNDISQDEMLQVALKWIR